MLYLYSRCCKLQILTTKDPLMSCLIGIPDPTCRSATPSLPVARLLTTAASVVSPLLPPATTARPLTPHTLLPRLLHVAVVVVVVVVGTVAFVARFITDMGTLPSNATTVSIRISSPTPPSPLRLLHRLIRPLCLFLLPRPAFCLLRPQWARRIGSRILVRLTISLPALRISLYSRSPDILICLRTLFLFLWACDICDYFQFSESFLHLIPN